MPRITLQAPAGMPITLVPTASPDGVFHIGVDSDAGGETFPVTTITATGGRLDCYKSKLTTSGPIVLHPFGTGVEGMAHSDELAAMKSDLETTYADVLAAGGPLADLIKAVINWLKNHLP